MRNTGNEILKKTLLHYINLEYYANGLDEEYQSLFKRLQEDCAEKIKEQKSISTKAGYTSIYRLVKEAISEFQNELEEELEEQAELIMNNEIEFLENTYNNPPNTSSNNTFNIAPLVIGGISLVKLLFASIDGRDTTKQFVERTAKNINNIYDSALRSAYLFGQSTNEVVNQIDDKLKQVSRGIQSGIRTAIPSYAKTVDREVFLFNNAEVVYCAQLDGRTCIVCGNNHGLHFKSISVAPSIPMHNNCRCVYLRAVDVKNPMPTYEEFITSLSDEEQKDILGKNRYELWKEYNIPLERFVNNGKVIPLKTLKENLS